MLYKQIISNKRKTKLLVLLFCVLVILVGSSIGYLLNGNVYRGLVISIVFLLVYIPFTYFTASKQILSMAGAKAASEVDYPELFNVVEELSISARIPVPEVYIVEDPSPNAFATGLSPEKGIVAVTSGLLGLLNREELEAVIGHEIAHIKNYDIRLSTLSISLVSVIVFLSEIGYRILFMNDNEYSNRRSDRNILLVFLSLFLVIFSPIIAQMIRFAISRNREFLADATAVELTRNPEGLINALRKISSSNLSVKNANRATASLYISSPFKEKGSCFLNFDLFSTHPSIEERIKRLSMM